jgi:hypothetical protein
MMNVQSPGRARCLLLLIVCAMGTASCGEVMGRLTRGYTGPQPSSDPLLDEIVVVRLLQTQAQGHISTIAERASFAAAGDPHNVNRVVRISTDASNQADVGALALKLGDTLVVSTRFLMMDEASGASGVPNWPGHKAMEYPISHHIFTSARRR